MYGLRLHTGTQYFTKPGETSTDDVRAKSGYDNVKTTAADSGTSARAQPMSLAMSDMEKTLSAQEEMVDDFSKTLQR